MKFRDYIESLSVKEQDSYAARCGTTGEHLRTHLKHSYKIPRRPLMENLWKESEGNVSKAEVLEHFYPDDAEAQKITAA